MSKDNVFGILGTEVSENDFSQFVGSEHLYDLGVIYRGCGSKKDKDRDNLIVINVPIEDTNILTTVTSTIGAVILNQKSVASKVQILFNPSSIELAYISLALRGKEANKVPKNNEEITNIEIEPGVHYDINNADDVVLLVILTKCDEELVGKLISQATGTDTMVYIVTNTKEVSDLFLPETNDDDDETDDLNTLLIPEISKAIENNDFSTLKADIALKCGLFQDVNIGGKRYIKLALEDDESKAFYFMVSSDGYLIKSDING